ncbi:MAG: sulfur carrier protein ThiS [Flavobacteriales bacterium]|nr:sulfur carrier protein ThiS [Flavobacteriales bacterium]
MEVYINDELCTYPDQISLKDLVQELKISVKGTALAVNDVVIPKLQWEQTQISHHDKILIIKAVQGG